MSLDFEKEHKEFLSLSPKGKILFVQDIVNEIVDTLNQKNVDIDDFVTKIALFKFFVSRLYRLSGVYKKEYFDFLVNNIREMWIAVESCSSQFMLYPALSAFIDLFSKLKGLNPYYTLHATLDGSIEYRKVPPKDQITELLQKEQQNLNFLIDYMQLDSVLRLNLTKKEKLDIIKSATNYAQLLVLMLFNFIVTVPVIGKEDFISWFKLFEDAIDKAHLGHAHLKEMEETSFGMLRTKISESSLYSLKAQLYLLNVRFLNENVSEILNLAYMENSRALQQLEEYKKHPEYADTINSFYYQQKSILLESRFYQILHDLVTTQYRNGVYKGDLRDEKLELTRSAIKLEVQEILSEIYRYVSELLLKSKKEDTGISFNLINIYAKISVGAYLYDLVDEVEKMEVLIKTQGIDLGDPELSLLLARYWLFKWGVEKKEEHLLQSQSYFERAAEVFEMLYNNRYVPIYSYSILSLFQYYLGNLPKSDFFIMKADDEFNDAKSLMIVSESERYYYEQFRDQIDQVLSKQTIEKPLRFDIPFNPLDFNSWLTESKDWRKNLSNLPEPFPFNLDQLKILEFEFISPNLFDSD